MDNFGDKFCDPAGLVQCPNSWIPPKSVGEGASSLFGGWPGSLEIVSCTGATPRLHRCKSGVAPVQEIFSRLSGPPPKRLLAPSPTDLGGIQEFGHCTRPAGSQDKFGESLGGSRAPPSFWEVPGLPRKFPELPRKFFGDFPGSSLTVELNSNPEVPRKFPKLPRKFPKLPRRSAPFSGKPDTLS